MAVGTCVQPCPRPKIALLCCCGPHCIGPCTAAALFHTPPFPPLYVVAVVTSAAKGSGTDGNVFAEVVGEDGTTGKHPLTNSREHMDKFETGNTGIQCHTLAHADTNTRACTHALPHEPMCLMPLTRERQQCLL